MAAPDVQRIARALTPGQRSTILMLEDIDFQILSCAEATAIRLSKGGTRRPPLVEAKPHNDPEFPMFKKAFRLNDLGVRVKAALALP